MDKNKTLEVLEALANGIDPVSSEVFPEDSPYQNVDVVRSLFHAIALIKEVKPKKDGPPRVGQAWDEQEDNELKEAFLSGEKIPTLAHKHQKTSGAIRSRLQKLGLIQEK